MKQVPNVTRAPVDSTEETRSRIKQAALRCVERYGLAKTGLGDIAKEAGCARQTVYNHYPDAHAVVAAALFDTSATFVAELRTAIRSFDSAGDRVLEAMRFCLARLPNEPMLQLITTPEGAPFARLEVFGSEPTWALLRSVAAECLAPAHPRSTEIDELAEMMTRTLLSLLMIEEPAARTEAQTRALLARWLLRPLGLEPSRARARRTPLRSRRRK